MTETATLTLHPVAEVMPEMCPEDYARLLEDIRRHGVREPILIDLEHRIIDGRHRWRASRDLGCPIKTEMVDPDQTDLLDLVVSKNLARRQLTTSQCAAIAADIANLKQGGKQAVMVPVSQAEAAKRLRVSERSVRKAVAIKKSDPALHAEVKAGKVSLALAHKNVASTAAKTSKAKAATHTAGSGKSTKKFPSVYAALFEELSALSDHLTSHPLATEQQRELSAALTVALSLLDQPARVS